MEVVKVGRIKAHWAREFECSGSGHGGGGCGATLLVSQSDLYEVNEGVGDAEIRHATFCCSMCGVETNISDPGVPCFGKRPTMAEILAIIEKSQSTNS